MARVDLILGAWAGRQAGPPRVFIDSARRAVPNAKIVVFCHDISDEASNFFRDSGVITRPFQHWRWWNGPVHTYRFVLFARYAAKHAPEFDHIMTADLRDVVVQSDPFAHLDSRNVHFFEEHSNQTLSSNRHYRRWMRRFVDEEDRRACANEIPVCCGIVLGGADEMARYLDALAKRLSRMG